MASCFEHLKPIVLFSCQFLLPTASQLAIMSMMETTMKEGKITKEWKRKHIST